MYHLAGIADDITKVMADPYAKEVLCRAAQLVALQQGQLPVMQCTKTASKEKTVLAKIVVPMRTAVAIKKHPILIPLGIGVAVGLPVLLGYWLGKRSK